MKFDNKGLTILEVLIASTLLAFVAIGVVMITDGSIKTKETLVSEDAEILQIETAMIRLENDFSTIYSPLSFSSKPDKNKDGDEGGGEGDSKLALGDRFAFYTRLGHPVPLLESTDAGNLTFMMAGHRRRLQDSKQSHYAWVRYALVNSNEGEYAELRRYYLADNIYAPDKIDWEQVKGHVLLKNLKSFKFSFWDEKKKEFTETLTNLEQGSFFIPAIRVEFTWVNKTENEVKDARIFVNPTPPFTDDTPSEEEMAAGDTSASKEGSKDGERGPSVPLDGSTPPPYDGGGDFDGDDDDDDGGDDDF